MSNLSQLQIQDPTDFNGGQAVSLKNPLPVQIIGGGSPAATQSPVSAAVVNYTNGAGVSSLVVKSAAGLLTFAYAVSTAAGYLIAIDAASVPASGSAITPIALWPAAANQPAGGSYTDAPLPVSAGLVLLMSSSATAYTPISATFLQGGAR